MQVNTNENTLIAKIVGLVIALVVVGMVLVPFVSDAQLSTSTEVNYDNESTLFKMANSDESVTISLSSGTVTLNDVEIEHTTNSNILLSDAFSVDQFLYQGNWLTRVWYKDSTALSYPSAFSLTFENGTVTGSITSGGDTNTFEEEYTYLYYSDKDGTYTQIASAAGIDIYVNSVEDIVLSGLYYTGNNATTYSYIDGVLTLEEDYVGSIEFTSEKVGMDVLNVTSISVSVGDETFTPYRFIVPTNVVGHTETMVGMLLSLIPIFVILAIIIGIVGTFAYNRYDN